MSLSQRERAQIVKMYKAGKKTAEITEATGAPRSSIYFVLRDEGVVPSRKGRTPRERLPLSASDAEKLNWALGRIEELDVEIQMLREHLANAAAALLEEAASP